MNLKLNDFKILKPFFFALSKGYFKGSLGQNFVRVPVDGVNILVDKKKCLGLLRSFPELDLQGEQFKDDNFLIKYLSNPSKLNHILGQLTVTQQAEFDKLVKEKPVISEQVDEQSSGQAATAEQTVPVDTTTHDSSGSIPFGPSGSHPAPHMSGRVIHDIPHTETPKSNIVIANKSGVVAEAPPTKVFLANSSGTIIGEHPIGPQPAIPKGAKLETPKPEIIFANKSGVVAEKPPTSFVIADKSGNIKEVRSVGSAPASLKGLGPETAPPKTISIADSRGNIVREHPIPTQGRFNFSNLRSKVGGRIAGAARVGLERANPFLKRAGNGLLKGLENITNPMGGVGSGSILSRVSGSRVGRAFAKIGRGVGGGGSMVGKAKSKEALVALSLLGFIVLVGGLTAFAPNPTPGEAAPVGTNPTSDISSCKFTRGGDSVKELTYKSPLLLNYIQEASNLTGIPPVVLAAFIRVETPGTVIKNDDEIRSLSSVANCSRSGTGALGPMQLQPEGTTGNAKDAIANGAKLIGIKYEDLTEEDYCDVRKNIIMGAGFILKKMSYSTPKYPKSYGDGTKWDASWTNDNQAIEKLVAGYYGCHLYGGAADCTGPYNYANDVSTSIQSCQPASTPAIPPAGPVPTEKLAQIVYWAGVVNNALEKGSTGSWDKVQADISNDGYTVTKQPGAPGAKYWCTYLVVDSYNLAGVKGLSIVNHGLVRNMQTFWQNPPAGYFYIPFDQKIEAWQQVKPGFAVIRIHPTNYQLDHADIVSNFHIDKRGNGRIDTLDSNGFHDWSSAIADGQPTDTSFAAPIAGFGGIKQ